MADQGVEQHGRGNGHERGRDADSKYWMTDGLIAE